MYYTILTLLTHPMIKCENISRVLEEAQHMCLESIFQYSEFFENNIVIFGTLPTEMCAQFVTTLPEDVQKNTKYMSHNDLLYSFGDQRAIRELFVEGLTTRENIQIPPAKERGTVRLNFIFEDDSSKKKGFNISFIFKSQYSKIDIGRISEVFLDSLKSYFFEHEGKMRKFYVSIAYLVDSLAKSTDLSESKLVKVCEAILKGDLHEKFHRWLKILNTRPWYVFEQVPEHVLKDFQKLEKQFKADFENDVLSSVSAYFPHFFEEDRDTVGSRDLSDEQKLLEIVSILENIVTRIQNTPHTHIIGVFTREEAENLSFDILPADPTQNQLRLVNNIFKLKPVIHCSIGRVCYIKLNLKRLSPYSRTESGELNIYDLEMYEATLFCQNTKLKCAISASDPDHGVAHLAALMRFWPKYWLEQEIYIDFLVDSGKRTLKVYGTENSSLVAYPDQLLWHTLFDRYFRQHKWNYLCWKELFCPFYGSTVVSKSSKTKKIIWTGPLDDFDYNPPILDQLVRFVRNLRKTYRISKDMFILDYNMILSRPSVDSLLVTKELDSPPHYFDLRPRLSEESENMLIFDICRVTSAFIHCRSLDTNKLCIATCDIEVHETNFIKMHFDPAKKSLCIEISQKSVLLGTPEPVEPKKNSTYQNLIGAIDDAVAHFLLRENIPNITGENILNSCLYSSLIYIENPNRKKKNITSFRNLDKFIRTKYPRIRQQCPDFRISFKIVGKCGDIHLSVSQVTETAQ